MSTHKNKHIRATSVEIIDHRIERERHAKEKKYEHNDTANDTPTHPSVIHFFSRYRWCDDIKSRIFYWLILYGIQPY